MLCLICQLFSFGCVICSSFQLLICSSRMTPPSGDSSTRDNHSCLSRHSVACSRRRRQRQDTHRRGQVTAELSCGAEQATVATGMWRPRWCAGGGNGSVQAWAGSGMERSVTMEGNGGGGALLWRGVGDDGAPLDRLGRSI